MGLIKDIVDIIVPNAQRRVEGGTSSKEALYEELKEIGYIPKDYLDGGMEND